MSNATRLPPCMPHSPSPMNPMMNLFWSVHISFFTLLSWPSDECSVHSAVRAALRWGSLSHQRTGSSQWFVYYFEKLVKKSMLMLMVEKKWISLFVSWTSFFCRNFPWKLASCPLSWCVLCVYATTVRRIGKKVSTARNSFFIFVCFFLQIDMKFW